MGMVNIYLEVLYAHVAAADGRFDVRLVRLRVKTLVFQREHLVTHLLMSVLDTALLGVGRRGWYVCMYRGRPTSFTTSGPTSGLNSNITTCTMTILMMSVSQVTGEIRDYDS